MRFGSFVISNLYIFYGKTEHFNLEKQLKTMGSQFISNHFRNILMIINSGSSMIECYFIFVIYESISINLCIHYIKSCSTKISLRYAIFHFQTYSVFFESDLGQKSTVFRIYSCN